MLGLPVHTEISKTIFKKNILASYEGRSSVKDKFNSEIDRIKIVNELSHRSLPIQPSSTIPGIFVIAVTLKVKQISETTIDLLFSLIKQKIVLLLIYENEGQLIIFHEKRFKTDWFGLQSYKMQVSAISMDQLWKDLVYEISGLNKNSGSNLEQQIKDDEKKQELNKKLEKLHSQMNRVKTPARQFEFFKQIKEIERELAKL